MTSLCRHCFRYLCVAFGLAVLFPSASGADAETQPTEPSFVDLQHDRLSDWILRPAEGINRYFREAFTRDEDKESRLIQRFYGDRLSAEEVRGTYITISPILTIHEKEDVNVDVDFSARLRLRQIHDRLRIFADSRDPDHDILEGVFSPQYRRELEEDERDAGAAGLIYMITERADRSLSLSSGLRYRRGVSPKIRLRGTLDYPFAAWNARVAQSAFWDRQTGFGEKTELSFRRSFLEIGRFGSTSAATWSETSQGVDWGQFLSCSAHFSPRKSLALKTGIRGHTHPSTVPQQYAIRIPYRQRIFRDWLFIELEPGADFLRENDYRFTPLMNITLDIVLGSFGSD